MISALPIILFTALLSAGVVPAAPKTKTNTNQDDDGSMTVQEPALLATAKNDQKHHPVVLQCWDDCFDEDALKSIRTAGNSCSTFFTSVFDRQQQHGHRSSSPLEAAIVSLLEQIEQQQQVNALQGSTEPTLLDDHASNDGGHSSLPPPDHRYVEYWVKHNAKSLEAHRDIDEEYCRLHQQPISLGSDTKIGIQHCPSFGHVFYFDIDDHEEDGGTGNDGVQQLRAPTVIWEEQQRQQQHAETNDFSFGGGGGGGGGGPPRPLQNLWTVPAVNNRLLRFRGDSLHAVLYPPLDFLHDTVPNNGDDHEIKKKVAASQQTKNQDGSVNTSSSDKTLMTIKKKRGVLLFNTWQEPPLYTPPEEEHQKVPKENLEPGHKVLSCKLNKPCVLAMEEEGKGQTKNNFVKLSVPLLGGINRRGCPQESLDSLVHEETAMRALTSKHRIHRLTLTTPPQNTN